MLKCVLYAVLLFVVMFVVLVVLPLTLGSCSAQQVQQQYKLPYDNEMGIFVTEVEPVCKEVINVYKACDTCEYETQMCTENLSMVVPKSGDCYRCRPKILLYGYVPFEQVICASASINCEDALRCW